MYSVFAENYDILMSGAGYEERADYIISLFLRFYGRIPSLLLDAGCGTGTMSCLMVKKGVKEVIGVDASSEMLCIADEKAKQAKSGILFLNQELQELDLYGTVDGVISTFDTVNHIISESALQKAFDKISLFMEPGSYFIFDVNSVYKHKKILGNNTFIYDEDEVYCVWQNRFRKKSEIVDITLDFFSREGENYVRTEDFFSERAYSDSILREMLYRAGLETQAVFNDMSFKPAFPKSEKKIFVAKKVN